MRSSVGVRVYRVVFRLSCVAMSVLLSPPDLGADTLFEDFSAGILPGRWEVFQEDAAGAPWTIAAPDESGWLRISKQPDNDATTAYVHRRAGIRSRFLLFGDFSASVAFDLIDFPGTNEYGWNEAVLHVGIDEYRDVFWGDSFEVLRFSGRGGAQYAEAFSTQPPPPHPIGAVRDSTVRGGLLISRQGKHCPPGLIVG